ncbi:MAG: ABC transporter permease [Deltaproteobacteria bacterium]|nr:ABC transporter permease [Deltaproteobacteria bacterium]
MRGLSIALKALSAHKLRTTLAILGVFLGTLVLTAVTHIGSAIILKADLETMKLGPNLVQVRATPIRFGRTSTGASLGITTSITMEDALSIRDSIPEIRDMSMFLQTSRRVRAGSVQTSGQIVGVNASYLPVRSLELLAGRFVLDEDEEEMALVCVLGNTLAERLFGGAEASLGQDVYIANALYRVKGVLEAKGADLGGSSFDEQVFIPLRTYQRRLVNSSRIGGLYMNLYDHSHTAGVKNSITNLLRLRHHIGLGQKDDFSVFAAEDAAKLRNETLELVTRLGALSAGISFIVGGLGIFSIMILLVKARQLEIGVRRAVGASRKLIVRQCFTEAGLMAGTGGAMGVLLSLLLVTAVYKIGELPFVYEPMFCLLATLASAVVGVAAGAWPARQAARVEVVTALKNWE